LKTKPTWENSVQLHHASLKAAQERWHYDKYFDEWKNFSPEHLFSSLWIIVHFF
jgi:hypothetical protein